MMQSLEHGQYDQWRDSEQGQYENDPDRSDHQHDRYGNEQIVKQTVYFYFDPV
jgi:hypothetical protein